jgi:hypothetical protein
VLPCFTGLLGTIQFMKKSKEGNPVASVQSCGPCDKDSHTGIGNVSVEDNGSLTASRDSSGSVPRNERPKSSSSLKHIKMIHDSSVQKDQQSISAQTKLVKTNRKSNSGSQADDEILQSGLKVTESGAFHSKSHRQKPHVEHREKGTTHFSHNNVKNFRESLSRDELHILSELALAASMPDEVRVSLQQFIDQQQSFDARVKTVENGAERPKRLNAPRMEWNSDEVLEPHKLKEVLGHVAKILQADKKKMVELAAEREWMLKEDAYHASMASFVELCIRTGMVR